MALKHAHLWAGLRALADDLGMTAAAWARAAGLDTTYFNPSRHFNRAGKPVWPSTETIAKLLDHGGMTLTDLALKVDGGVGKLPTVPLTTSDELKPELFTAEGIPVVANFDKLTPDFLQTPDCYAVELMDDRWAPTYRAGDIVVASAHGSLRRHDKVVVYTDDVVLYRYIRQTATVYEFEDLARPEKISVPAEAVKWTARILWATQ